MLNFPAPYSHFFAESISSVEADSYGIRIRDIFVLLPQESDEKRFVGLDFTQTISISIGAANRHIDIETETRVNCSKVI